MDDETELKPCPWGDKPKHGLTKGTRDMHGDLNQNYAVWSDYARVEAADKERAFAIWNTRATMDKADMARTLQHLIKTEGIDSAYVWLGEVATGEEQEFSRPGNEIYET